jgi:hypothetical protein
MTLSSVAERARLLLQRKSSGLPDPARVRSSMISLDPSSADDFYSALVEGAFLVAAADGDFSPEEASTLGETIGYVTGEALPTESFRVMIDAFAEALVLDGFQGRIQTLADTIADDGERREIVAFAALLGFCDHDFDDRERRVIYAIGRAFSIPDAETMEILGRVETALRDLA